MPVKLLIAAMIFGICVSCGMGIASQKLLWNDELFTQVETIDRLDYPDIWRGNFPEGNLSPLFYLGQKFICRLTDYRLPVRWNGEFCVYEPRGQVVLRILPVVCMSLAVALIFLYFACRVSAPAGFLGLAVTLSGFSVWAFMPEARPYSLWFLLCSLQAMLFLEILDGRNAQKRWPWVFMALVNILLSLTIFFSALPVIAVSAVLFFRHTGRYMRHCIFVTVLPLAGCVLYYLLAKRTYSNLSEDPGHLFLMLKSGAALFFTGGLFVQRDLFLANIPPFWGYFLGIGSCVIGWQCLFKRGADVHEGFKGLFLAFVMMLVMVCGVIIWFFGWKASGNFGIAERYFIFLTPFAVFLIMSLVRALWHFAKEDGLCRLMVVVSTGSMLALTSLWTHIHLMKWGPFWSL